MKRRITSTKARELLALNMKIERVTRAISQEELASLCGLSKNQIGLIERKQVACTVDVVEQIAKGLSLEIAALFQVRK